MLPPAGNRRKPGVAVSRSSAASHPLHRTGHPVLAAIALYARCIDRLNEIIGETVAWLLLGVVGICFTGVVLRYVFGIGFVWVQDAYVWLHAAILTLVAGFALKEDRHVRVDLIYGRVGRRARAWIDLFGVFVFLMPFCIVLLVHGYGWAERSWGLAERSVNFGGLPGLYLVKSCLPVMAMLLALQGLALAGRSVLLLAGNGDRAEDERA